MAKAADLVSQNLGQTWSSYEDLGHGIYVYRDVLPKSLNIIDRIESVMNDNNPYNWQQAMVGYSQVMKDYRDCVDFKYKKSDLYNDGSKAYNELASLWQDCFDRKFPAVEHYRSIFRIGELRYWESFNFIRYGEGQHFMEHHDHGYSYNCTVSLVAYPNDDYEGGELSFRLQGLKIKPKAGDVYLFPSNYMYPHVAEKVTSGIKYSIVTMLDYSDKFHNPRFYAETGS
jgi:hypothetical protein